MQLQLVVKYTNDHTEEVTAIFADFVAFERTWSRSVIQFETEARLTDVAWIAWKALTRSGRTTLNFDPEWLNSVESIEHKEREKTIPLDGTAQSVV